jgi:hypothetical protein
VTRGCRILSGVTLLLALIGLPVAAVACELACPEAPPALHVAAAERPVVGAPASPSCHETRTDVAQTAPGPSTSSSTAGASSSRAHGCDHPAVATAPRSEGGVRVPQPTGAAALAPALVVLHTRHSWLVSAPRQARAPASPPLAFSLVLRI